MFQWLHRLLPDRKALDGQEDRIISVVQELTEALKRDDEERIERLRLTLNEERKIVQ